MTHTKEYTILIFAIALLGHVGYCTAQENINPRNFVIKFSPVHLFERTLKVGFEYKTKSLRHSLSIYGSGVALREHSSDYRILNGYSGELQYRYYTTNDFRPERTLNMSNFFMGFARASVYRETYQTNPPISQLLKESTYTAKDFGVGYGMQVIWRRFTAEFYFGPAKRFNDVDSHGSREGEAKSYRELDHRRTPALDHNGWFAKAGFEIGFTI